MLKVHLVILKVLDNHLVFWKGSLYAKRKEYNQPEFEIRVFNDSI